MDQTEVIMGRNVNSLEEITNQENVLHIDRNNVNARKKHWANWCCYTKKVHEASAAPLDDFVPEEVTTSNGKKSN